MKKLLLLIFFSLSAETPWGPDSDLQYCHHETAPPPLTFGRYLASAMIAFHQDVISPADGPRSHYYPSSSQYTKEAIQKHGFLPGFFLGCDRLMRENDDDWLYPKVIGPEGNCLKFDPVR